MGKKIKKFKVNNPNYVVAAASGMFLLALDVVTKSLAVLMPFKPMTIVGRFFYLAPYQKNDGIAFGIDIPMWLQIGGSLVFIAILIELAEQYIFKSKKHLFFPAFLFGLLIGGAAGNLINRLVQGYVVDFIVLKPFPLFNIADVGITIGLIGIFIISCFSPDFQKSLENAKK